MSWVNEVNKTLAAFSDKMSQKDELDVSAVSIRVIGEFSAGKTRFVRTLIEELAPPELLPISSLEKQTLLPLEVTYGPVPGLFLIDRSSDIRKGEIVRVLNRFPDRDALSADHVDPAIHRLRLEVPEPRLILAKGDGRGEKAKRLFLLDMPGWNSDDEGDNQHACSTAQMFGQEHTAIVFVAKINRLDHRVSLEKLIESLVDANFIDNPNLYYLITAPDCTIEERNRCKTKEHTRVQDLLNDCFSDENAYGLHIECVDFKSMSIPEKQKFRDHFWNAVGRSVSENTNHISDWERMISRWPAEYDIRPKLKKVGDAIDYAGALLSAVKNDGMFLKGMNNTKLLNLDAPARANKLLSAWKKQLGVRDFPIRLMPDNIELPENHPLFDWWSVYVCRSIHHLLNPVETFFAKAEHLLRSMPEGIDIEPYLTASLSDNLNDIIGITHSSFSVMCRCLSNLADEKPAAAVATAIALSLLDARYNDFLTMGEG